MLRLPKTLVLLTIAAFAAGGIADAQHTACAASQYIVVPASGGAAPLSPAARIPCPNSANEPLKLGDLTPGHINAPNMPCNRACDDRYAGANLPQSQRGVPCGTLVQTPSYENVAIVENVATACQGPRPVTAPSFIAPVRPLSIEGPRRALPAAVQPDLPAHHYVPMRQDVPMRQAMPLHPMPPASHGNGSRVPH